MMENCLEKNLDGIVLGLDDRKLLGISLCKALGMVDGVHDGDLDG